MFDPIFTASNNLKLLKKYIKNQEASYNFRLGFALSNRAHFHRVYLVTVRFHLILSVLAFKVGGLKEKSVAPPQTR